MAQTPLELRLALLKSGYDPIPLRGKRPAMNAWTGVVADPDLIRLWSSHKGYPDAVNTGVLARRTPGLDLDVLNPECVEAMVEHIRERFEERGTILCRIGRWPKCLIPFRTDEPFKKITLPLGRGEEKIEFLSDGQQFASFGPHPDTREDYQWPRGSILEIPREELPYIREDEADDEVRELGKIAILFGYNPKPKHDGSGNGSSADPIDIQELTRAILAGESLHPSVLSIAGSYAGRGSPKQDCIDYIGLAFTAAHQPRYGGRWDECVKAINYCYAKEDEKQPPPQPPPLIYTAAELEQQTFPPILTVVEGLFVEGLTLLASKPKTGKSWLAIHAALAVASFGKTLGELACDGGNALYCALEDNPERMQRRLRKLDLPAGWPARLHITHRMPKLASGGLKFISDWLSSVKDPRLVIIDTLEFVRERVKNGDNPYAADYAVGADLQRLASERHVAIVVIHHLRKAEAEDPFDTVSGTLGLTGAADTVLVITRDGPGATQTYTLHGRGRDLEPIERPLVFDPITSLWTLIGETPKAADPWQKRKSLTLLKRALDSALLDHGETIKPWSDSPSLRGVREFSLRSEFYKVYPATEGSTALDKTNARQRAFTRAVKAASDASLLGSKEIDGIVFFWSAAART